MSIFTTDQLITLVLDSFKAEQTNEIAWARENIASDFKQRSMIVSGDTIFPVFSSGASEADLQDAYSLKGRTFHVWNIAANEATQTVFVELAEVEPKGDTQRIWPYVLVCQIKAGKIWRSRHYGDPALLSLGLNINQIREAVED